MKLTDLAIVFQLFFICLIVVLHAKTSYVHTEMMAETMHNNVIDGIVEDALTAGFYNVDRYGNPMVDLDKVLKCFVEEHKLYGSEDRQILLYVDEDGYYVWDSENILVWSSIIDFSDGANTSHEKKILELTTYMEHTYHINMNIPFNDGETWANTVDDYSLLAISINKNWTVSCFSGAKIHS